MLAQRVSRREDEVFRQKPYSHCVYGFGSTRAAGMWAFSVLSAVETCAAFDSSESSATQAGGHLRGCEERRDRQAYSPRRFRKCCERPAQSCSNVKLKASQIRKSVNTVTGRPASNICQ